MNLSIRKLSRTQCLSSLRYSIIAVIVICTIPPAIADESEPMNKLVYQRAEICLEPGEPTQLFFSDEIEGRRRWPRNCHVFGDRSGSSVVLYANPELTVCDLNFTLKNGVHYLLRFKKASVSCPRLERIRIIEGNTTQP